jgi:hypothetical protein
MNTNLILTIVPLIAFVIADAYAGPKWGILTAVIFSLAILLFEVWQVGELQWISTIEPTLIVLLALLAFAMKSPQLFLYQPSAVSLVLVLFLGYFQWFDQPYFGKQLHVLQKFSPPEVKEQMASEAFKNALDSLSLVAIFLIALHGSILFVLAKAQKKRAWILTRLAIYPVFIAVAFYVFWSEGVYG